MWGSIYLANDKIITGPQKNMYLKRRNEEEEGEKKETKFMFYIHGVVVCIIGFVW